MVTGSEQMDRIEAAVEALTGQFGTVAVRLDSIDVRLENIDVRFDNIDVCLDNIDVRFDSIDVRLDNIDERLGGVERRLGKVEVAAEDLKDEVTAALTAIDKDAETIINHEQRIVRLEKVIVA